MNFHLAKSFIKHFFSATTEHGVHSPFIFNFLIDTIYSATKHDELIDINEYRQNLLNNNTVLNVEDYGAGSTKLKSNNRTVSEMARVAGAPVKESELLFKIVKHLRPDNILELGTSLGLSTFTFKKAYSKSNITTIEGSSSIYKFNEGNFYKNNLVVNTINDKFDDYLENIEKDKTLDLVFIDGNHTYDATLKYYHILKKHITNKTIFIFDDIHWSKGMYNAWKEICSDNLVTASLDMFHFGIVFFNENLSKQHYIIKPQSIVPKGRFRGIK